MRAHLVQMDLAWEDKEANFARARDMVAEAAPDAGDLVVLPEMFDTGFSFRLERTADTDEKTLGFLRTLAIEHQCYLHGARTLVTDEGLGRNLASILSPTGELLCEYAKIHPFGYGGEGERFTHGREVMTWDLPIGGKPVRVCPAICYDLRFPELFRLGLDQGAEVFVESANWPSPRIAHWRALNIARAIENQALVLAVNRCGSDPHLDYGGDSIAIGPKGEILAEAGEGEEVLSVEVDPEAVRAWRAEFPAWKDGRLGVMGG